MKWSKINRKYIESEYIEPENFQAYTYLYTALENISVRISWAMVVRRFRNPVKRGLNDLILLFFR